MNQHVTDIATVEHIDPETGEITEVSTTAAQPTDQAEAPAAETATVEVEPKPPAVKRKLPLQPILEEKVPPLPTPAADHIDPDWDIAKVATRGAVHLERFFVMSEKLFWPSILLVLLAASLIFYAMPIGGMTSSLMGPGSGGMTRFLMMFLPFFAVGVALCVLLFRAADYQFDDAGYVYAGGGVVIGGILMALWLYSAENPNGTFAWVLSGVRVALALGIVIWIGNHLRKIRTSGESRMVLWMAGTYVGIVITASVVLASLGAALSGFGPTGMRTISAMLTFDRDSYFDLGGGLRSGPEYRWMGEHAPKGGLSLAKLNALIASVRADYAKHSNDGASWEEVTKLDPQPLITRPEKAIRDNAKELPNGIVVIPEGNDPISIIAHVEGQWSVTVIAPRDCAIFLGPFESSSGCQNATTPERPINSYVSQILDSLKPTPAVAEVKE